jgi:predicted ATPase/DNA-binding winged helix-turn-helix (wHTH) protein
MSQQSRQNLHFLSFHITSDVDLLYCRDVVVPLEPSAVRVLRYLAEHTDRVVSKEELLEAIWPDVFTTDGVLKKAVLQSRRALGDNPDNPSFIKTYHRRGYRFIAPVTRESPEERRALEASDKRRAPVVLGERVARSSRAALHPVDRRPDKTVQALDRLADGSPPDYDQLVGRESELLALVGEFRRTLKATGRPVLVTGEPGIGKTQLARHFARWAQEQGALCLYARFFDYEGSHLAPYEVFLDLLRDAFDGHALEARVRRDTRDLRSLRVVAQARCGVTLPEDLFAELKGSAESSQSAVGAAAAGDQFRAVAPISQCFVSLSREQPLVIFLDDIQWADEASLAIVGYLMRTASQERLMLVPLVRTEEMSDASHPVSQWLKRQADYKSYTSLALQPLKEDATDAAIQAIFGGGSNSPQIPPRALQTICRSTGGNPYFLNETIRLLIAEGAIVHDQSQENMRWQWQGVKDLRLPDTLVMAAGAKLDRLSKDVRELAEQASVIGDEFRVETLALMSDRSEDEVERLMEEGVRLGVLTERGLLAGEDCRFYHSILRRVLYDGLSPRKRKRLHGRAANALEVVYAREADRTAEAISVHAEAACDWQKAFDWSMRAWNAASSRRHWSQAIAGIERAGRAAAQLEDDGANALADATRLRLLLGLGEGYFSVGRLTESETVLSEAVALARLLDNKPALASALFLQGQTRNSCSMYREVDEPTEQALELYRQMNDADGIAQSLLQLGSGQIALGNYESAAHLIEQALEHVGSESYIAASALGDLGWAHVLQGNYSDGLPLLERALSFHMGLGDVRERAVVLRCLNWASHCMGQYEKAIQLATRAGTESRSIEDIHGETKSQMRVGRARVAQGLYDEGIVLLNRTLETLRVTRDAHCEAETLWTLGVAYLDAGQILEATPLLDRSLKMIQSIGDRDDEFRILTDIARLQILKGDAEQGLRTVEEAIGIAEELRNRDGLGVALVAKARACLALEQFETAYESAKRAVDLLDQTGSGERWRGYQVLGLALDAVAGKAGPSFDTKSQAALQRSVNLLEEIRNQIGTADRERRANFTRARSGPARDLKMMMLRQGRQWEAAIIARRWMLDEPEIRQINKA